MFWFLIGVLLFIVGVVCSFLFFTQEIIPIFGWLMIIIGGGIMCYNGDNIKQITDSNKNQPQAIDVYRGKTKLKIISTTDTIVVWK